MEVDIKKIQESIYLSSQEDLKEILSLLKKHSFYDFLFYMTLSIQKDINEWKPVADLPISSIEYLMSLVLWINKEDIWTERAEEDICHKCYKLIEKLWAWAWLWTMLFSSDSLVAKVSWEFLWVRWHDYDSHLIEYLKDLFWNFDDFFIQKIWFTIDDIIKFYVKSKIIDREHPFVFLPETTEEIKICSYLWASIWDNKSFFDWKYWWLFWNRSIVPEKCIINHESLFFIFQPQLILWNIKDNFENELKKDQKIWNNYDKHRSNILEKKSIEYITNILPWSIWYTNLKYWWKYETDWIIIYDNNLFIIEAKSWVLRKRSTKWDVQALEEDINKLMLDWYNQWLRTKEYIETNKEAEFFDDKWNKILINKNDFSKTFIINTTWDFLGSIAIQLDKQKEKWKIQNNVNFWSIYINDLRVISELIEFPSQFILFLERRIKLIDKPQINFADELDIFMNFLEEWLYFDNWKVYWQEINENTMFSMDTRLTDKIDRYYWFDWEKPIMKIDTEIRKIIDDILQCWKLWFSEVSTFILSVNPDDTINALNYLKDQYLNDKKTHTATLLFNAQSLIEVVIFNDNNKHKYTKYSKAKLLQLWLSKAYNIFFEVSIEWTTTFKDFDIIKIQEGDIIDDEIKKEIERLKKHSNWCEIDINSWKMLTKKSPCPCGSWKKYKRCCRDKYHN